MQRLKQLRKENGITAKQLAEKLQVSESTISLYENGKREPDFKMLLNIADYFNVSVDYLLGKDEQKEKPTENRELSQHDRILLGAYYAQPEIQPAVDRLLGIEKDGKVLIWTAAQMPANKPDEIVAMDREKWSSIEQAPETDEELK